MGDPVPGGVRRRRRRHARLRAGCRGAHAGRLLGRDHALRAHLARDAADLPVRHRGTEARVDAAAVLGRAARGVRPDRARGRLGRREHAHAGAPRGRRMGDRRRQAVHHQRRHRHLRGRLHHRCHRRGRRGAQEISNISCPTAPRATSRASPTARWAGTRPTRGRSRSATAACPRRICSARAGPASSSSCRSSTSAASGWPRWASASRRARSTRRSPTPGSAARSASRSPSSRRSRPSSRTCQPRSRRHGCWSTRPRSEKDAGRNFTLTAAQAKLKTGRLAVRCGEEAVQIHGGYGYIEEYPVCRFYRDAKILTIGEGTDEVQQMVIARALGA